MTTYVIDIHHVLFAVITCVAVNTHTAALSHLSSHTFYARLQCTDS